MGIKQILKARWLDFVIELVLGYITLKISFDLFLLYAFFVIILEINISQNYLRKLITFLNLSIETRVNAILKKEGVSDVDVRDAAEEMKKTMGAEKAKKMEEDFKDLY